MKYYVAFFPSSTVPCLCVQTENHFAFFHKQTRHIITVQHIPQYMQFSGEKRKPLADISNECEPHQQYLKLSNEFQSDTFLPIPVHDAIVQQNLHPQLSYDLITEHLSYDQLLQLLDPANDVHLIELLTTLGVIAESQQCKFCGGPMRKFKEKIYWYWICTRRVNGVKCATEANTPFDRGLFWMRGNCQCRIFCSFFGILCID